MPFNSADNQMFPECGCPVFVSSLYFKIKVAHHKVGQLRNWTLEVESTVKIWLPFSKQIKQDLDSFNFTKKQGKIKNNDMQAGVCKIFTWSLKFWKQ